MLPVCHLDDGPTIKKGLLQVRHCVCYKFVTGSVTSSSLGHWNSDKKRVCYQFLTGSVTSSSLGHWNSDKKKKGRRVTKTFHMFPLVLGDFF